MLKGKMTTEAIPERVYALCKLVQKKHLKSKEAQELMEPSYLNSTPYFRYYKDCAIELELIREEEDKTLVINTSDENINSIENMRKYIIKNLNKFHEGNFYKVTTNFYKLNVDYVSNNIKSLSENEFMALVRGDTTLDVKEIRGWRFWISFLGLADLSGKDRMFCVPNAYRFLNDVLDMSKLEKGRTYSMDEFMDIISEKINIIQSISDKNLNFGMSTGFRILEKKEKLNLVMN